jgi:PAS domain S-box-containing protein
MLRESNQLCEEMEIKKQPTPRESSASDMAVSEPAEWYKRLFESAMEGMLVIDPSARVLAANRAAAVILGYNNTRELVGKPYTELILNLEGRKNLFSELTSKGGADNYELVLKRKDGTCIVVLGSAVVHREKGGEILQTDLFFMDITERKRVEEGTRISEGKYRNLVENSKDSIVILDMKGNVLFGNKATEELTGYSVAEGVRMNVRDITPLRYWPKSLGMLLRARTGRQIPYFESVIKRKDGQLVSVETGGQAVIHDGKVVGIQVITRDITERRRADEKLLQSEERFRRIAERSFDAIIAIDPDGLLTFVSPSVERIVGYRPEELVGVRFQGFICESEMPKVTRAFSKMMKGDNVEGLQLQVRRKDGSLVYTEVNGSPILRDGRVVGMQGILRDTTERKQAEEALRRSETKIRGVLDALPDLVFHVSSDGIFLDYHAARPEDLAFAPNAFLGKSLRDMFPQIAESALSAMAAAKRTGSVQTIEYQLPTMSGKIGEYEARFAPTEVGDFLTVVRDITERKRAEAALRESEERFRSLVEGTAACVGIIDLTGRLIYVNGAFADLMGYSVPELLGRPFLDYLHPEDAESMLGLFLHGLSSEAPEIEFRAICKDGSTRHLWTRPARLTTQGEIIGFVSIVVDITERKRMESTLRGYSERLEQLVEQRTEELRATKERLQFMITASPAMTFTGKPHYPYGNTYMSENVREVLGYAPSDFVEDPKFWADRIHSDDKARVLEEQKRLLEDDRLVCEYRFQRKDDTYCWMHDEVRLVRDSVGNPLESVGYWVDITARKEAEETVHRNLEQLAALDATVLEITQPHDLPELLKTVVERAVRLLRAGAGGMYLCDPERQELRLVVNYGTPKDYTGIVLKYGEGAAGRVARTGESLIIEDYRTWEGRARIFEQDRPFGAVLVAPLIWQDQVVGTIDVMDDAQNRHFTEDDLKLLSRFATHAAIAVENAQLLERLLKTERMAAIGETAAMVGHDLRNPLQGIAVAEYFLKKRLDATADTETKKMLHIIEDSIGYSDKIVNDLLDYSGEIVLEPTETPTKSVVADALLAVAIPGNIAVQDSTPQELRMVVDTARIRRLFINIIKNAIEAMPKGGKLAIRSRKSDGNVEVVFSDTGAGMPKDVMQRLWRPLQTTKARGMGLGLAISKRIVDAHRGSIRIESKDGGGTTVTVTLPLRQASFGLDTT